MIHSADNSEIQTQPVDANFFEHHDSNGGELIPSVAIDRIIALRTEGLKNILRRWKYSKKPASYLILRVEIRIFMVLMNVCMMRFVGSLTQIEMKKP